jgi:hypothetical protein
VIRTGNSSISPIIEHYSDSPEGELVAPPGSICLSANGTLYVKATGTGDTGWTAAGAGGGLSGTAVSLSINLDGGGSVIPTGVAGDIHIPSNFTITGWNVVADQSGDLVVDLWNDAFGSFPPTVGDTITGSEKPTLSSQLTNQDLTLTTWDTSLAADTWLRVNVDSAATVTRATVTIRMTRV